MNKKITIYLTWFLAGVIVAYLGYAFINLNLDITTWSKDERSELVSLCLGLGLISGFIRMLIGI